jgi:starvation-inducible DNA-binding protein
MHIDIGLQSKDREKASDALKTVLSDTFCLSVKTLGAHWNVKGMSFYGLHKLFQEQYEALGEALDEIAERMRALGHMCPNNVKDLAGQSIIKEEENMGTAEEMLQRLCHDHEQLVKRCGEALAVCDSVKDEVSVDLMVGRMKDHGHQAWILRSHLSDEGHGL